MRKYGRTRRSGLADTMPDGVTNAWMVRRAELPFAAISLSHHLSYCGRRNTPDLATLSNFFILDLANNYDWLNIRLKAVLTEKTTLVLQHLNWALRKKRG